jgi:hypothetical protein
MLSWHSVIFFESTVIDRKEKSRVCQGWNADHNGIADDVSCLSMALRITAFA